MLLHLRGTGGDREADIWLRSMDTIFTRLEGSDEQRVSLATYKLQGGAEDLWDAIEREYEDKKHDLTWTEFKKCFRDEYYPWTLRKNKKTELLHLQQGDMTVAEYQIKFNELSCYPPEIVATQEDKVLLFENGLRPVIKETFIMNKSNTIYEAIESAKNAETSCGQANKRHEQFQKRQREQSQCTQKNKGGDYLNKKLAMGNPLSGCYMQHRYTCNKCGNFDLFTQYCDGKTKYCFNCGNDGHLSYGCPNPKSTTGQKTSFNSNSQPSNALQKGALQSQKSDARGHIYVLNGEKAEASPSVVQGTISISNIPARVLIDLGCTHLVASPKFLICLGLPIEKLDHSLAVSTPIVDTIIFNSVCKGFIVDIDGKVSSLDLIKLQTHDFDVILGMNWLSPQYAIVDCHMKIVVFSPLGEREFIFVGKRKNSSPAIITTFQATRLLRKGCYGYLAYVIGTGNTETNLSEVPIVNEFLDVFPDDLSERGTDC